MIKSYFDLSNVLIDEETVPVTFLVPSFNIGKNISARTPDGEALDEVKANSVATVPLWAAVALRKEGHIALQVPQRYTTAVFREFKTDPLAANLYAKSPYYYEAGLLLCAMLPSHEGNRLAAQLFRLYQLRYLKVLQTAAKRGFDLKDVREKLSESERTMLDALIRGLDAERQSHHSVL